MGRRKRPFYRLVAIDSRKRRDGAEIERLGWFDPLRTDVAVEIKEDRVLHWLGQGAQPSETVDNIFTEIGLNYKRHLMAEGKSEEEIATLLTEWQARQTEKKVALSEKKAAKKKASEVKAEEVLDDVETEEEAQEAAGGSEVKVQEEVAENIEKETKDAPTKESDTKKEVKGKESSNDEEEVKAD